jgi:predicted nucleic acid-binding protein
MRYLIDTNIFIYYWGTEAEAQVDAIVSTGMGTASYELAAATDPDSCHE